MTTPNTDVLHVIDKLVAAERRAERADLALRALTEAKQLLAQGDTLGAAALTLFAESVTDSMLVRS